MTEMATSPRYLSGSSTRTSISTSTTPAPRSANRSATTSTQPIPTHRTPSRPLPTSLHHPATGSSARSPSPSYFSFTSPDTDSPPVSRDTWGSPTSTVRSTAAASPTALPHDQNPAYEAFRRQSEGKAFNLGGLGQNFASNASPSRTGRDGPNGRLSRRTSSFTKEMTTAEIKSQALEPPANELSRSPKRMLSPGSIGLPEEVRKAPSASFSRQSSDESVRRGSTSREAQSRVSLPLDRNQIAMSSRLPEVASDQNTTHQESMVLPQQIVRLIDSKVGDFLILDLRVATHYAQSHITGALSLCIPTTLLKRPSFNVQKLADTFKDETQRKKFETWRSCKHLVVYDTSSAEPKDALICVNTIKKFRSEGYDGDTFIIKGGFAGFAKTFPNYVESGFNSKHSASAMGVESDGPKVAPVAGGCPMPATDNAVNPFFGNIRQNMDLIGGVGQLPLQHPANASKAMEDSYPEWLQTAADRDDGGQKVSQKFETIERGEKRRMEDALSGEVSWGTPSKEGHQSGVQIAGLEKGNKNRYNNIWPFEHSRVKLEGVPSLGCDYFNASFIKATWSNKRYICTQAPIPATLNDFWNVVWQQDVRVIVMLTAEKEGAQIKAHNYWKEGRYGPLRLEPMSEHRASIDPDRIYQHQRRSATKHQPGSLSRSSTISSIDSTEGTSRPDQPIVVVRRFHLSNDKLPFSPMREITQLHYSGWPDFGAPASPSHLLGLVEQTDAVSRRTTKSLPGDPAPPNMRPVLVHCSAGCGRTGTFCTVDSVIDMLKRQRLQRRSRAQSQSQGEAQRQPTPMDLDSSPAPKSLQFTNPNARPGSSSSGSSNSTIGSVEITSTRPLPTPVPENVSDVGGSWVAFDDRDLIEKTVNDFRAQRISMVQSLRQFVLCYESVMEWFVHQRPMAQGGGEIGVAARH